MNPLSLRTYFKRCIYASESGIKVYQNLLYRWLTFSTRPIQTLINRRHPERPLLKYIEPITVAALTEPGKTCLLGLGGGAIAHGLQAAHPSQELDILEISQEVIEVANKYFYIKDLKNIQVIQQDAAEFIKETKSEYQHILVDLFDANAFPENCNNQAFFKNCYDHLAKDGVLAINLANPHQQRGILNYIEKYFDQGIVTVPIEYSANIVILASKTKKVEPLLDLFYQNFQIKSQQWDPLWGYMIDI